MCLCGQEEPPAELGAHADPSGKRVGRHCTSMSPNQCLTKHAKAATVKDSTDHQASSLSASVLQLPQQTIQQLPTSVCFTLTLSHSSGDPLTQGSPSQTALKPNLCLLASFPFQREKQRTTVCAIKQNTCSTVPWRGSGASNELGVGSS